MIKYLITTEKEGIYLGNCMGLGFWSKLDRAGQTHAVVFPDRETVASYIQTWEVQVPDIFVVPIEVEDPRFVDIEEAEKTVTMYRDRQFIPWKGDYEKHFYDVMLPDGRIAKCFPNAGKMNEVNTNNQFEPKDVVGVKPHTDDEWMPADPL